MRQLLLLPIRFYQYAISPMMVSRCRYHPSCSQYAIEAITRHGGIKGVFLSLKRLLRCHPWSQGGYDPVPGTDVRTTITNNCCEPAGQTHIPNQTKR